MQDPLKYFRVESREIVEQLQAALLALERGESQAPKVALLLRLAHTLKGAARVVKQLEIATLSHDLEDLLVPHRERGEPIGRELIDRLLRVVDDLARSVGGLTPAPLQSTAEPAAPAAAPNEEAPRSAVAAEEHVESLSDGVAELGFRLTSVRQALPLLGECRNLADQLLERLAPQRGAEWSSNGAVAARALTTQLEANLLKLERTIEGQVGRATLELSQVRDRVEQLRLVAASSMFGSLERATRDCAVSVGKLAHFEARGGDVRIDAGVLAAVQRALLQAVRNAVAHGIESREERAALGKPAQGKVSLKVSRRGKFICFVCDDDGGGVDLERVQREAVKLGRIVPDVAPSSDQLLSLLLLGGISTSPKVSQVSGRGVGLDLIRESLAGVGGSVRIETASGSGTSVELLVPASLSALEVLLVEAAGQVSALPLDAVVRALRPSASDLQRTNEATTLPFEGQMVPFFWLSWLLRVHEDREHEQHAIPTLILRTRSGLLALGVDRVLHSEGVVARGLPDSVELDSTIAGVTLDADGNPRPLLDPDGLFDAASHTPLRPAHGASRKRTVLVIDDSLTTRMLEQSILESAGYCVELATSAEEGLQMARAKSFDLFLVDVEMPGMDGFTFVERTRADPQLSLTPAVWVTSRASPEDLARGRAAGASGHIAKGEFDQVEFLERIGRLTR